MKRTLYDILGVSQDAIPAEITAAYHLRLEELKRAPPADAASTMPLLRDAHQTLSDSRRRDAYDASLAARAARPAPEPADETPPSALAALLWSGWRKWALGLAVILAIGVWWKMRSPAPAQRTAPPAVVVQRTEVPDSRAAPPPRAAQAPRAPAAASPAPPAAPGTAEQSAEEIFRQVSPSVAKVTAMDGSGRPVSLGSGIVIDRGTVLTNCHVVRRAASVSVKVGDDAYSATVQTADEVFDLCTLSVPGLSAPAVAVGTVKTLRTGKRVYAIGAPQGLELTISDGIVSALREMSLGTVIQITAPVSPGSSGGGLFDATGQLVGIVTFQHRYGQNLNFAVPADWIGEMRTRTASSSPSSVEPPTAARSGDDSIRRLILGKWSCSGGISARSGEHEYAEDGGFVLASVDGMRNRGQYTVAGRTVHYRVLGTSYSFAIESLSSERMVLQAGLQGERLACERRS